MFDGPGPTAAPDCTTTAFALDRPPAAIAPGTAVTQGAAGGTTGAAAATSDIAPGAPAPAIVRQREAPPPRSIAAGLSQFPIP